MKHKKFYEEPTVDMFRILPSSIICDSAGAEPGEVPEEPIEDETDFT